MPYSKASAGVFVMANNISHANCGMWLTLHVCEAPTCETRPDHNTGKIYPFADTGKPWLSTP